jgi:hypothetical protein
MAARSAVARVAHKKIRGVLSCCLGEAGTSESRVTHVTPATPRGWSPPAPRRGARHEARREAASLDLLPLATYARPRARGGPRAHTPSSGRSEVLPGPRAAPGRLRHLPAGRGLPRGSTRPSVGAWCLRFPRRVVCSATAGISAHLGGGREGAGAARQGPGAAGLEPSTIPDRMPDRLRYGVVGNRLPCGPPDPRQSAKGMISTSSGLVVGRASAASRREPKYCSTTLVTLAVTMENSARAETLFPIHCAAYTALFFSPSATTPTTEPER